MWSVTEMSWCGFWGLLLNTWIFSLNLSVRKMLKVVFPVMEIILEWYLLDHTDLAWCDGQVEGKGLNMHSAEEILQIVSAHKISIEQVRTWPAWSDVLPASKGLFQRFAWLSTVYLFLCQKEGIMDYVTGTKQMYFKYEVQASWQTQA